MPWLHYKLSLDLNVAYSLYIHKVCSQFNFSSHIIVFFLPQALVDGPCTDVSRQALSFKHLSLTDLKIKVPRSAHSGVIKKTFISEEVSEKWEKTSWAKKLATRKKRASLTDFDRFKLKLAKQRVSKTYSIDCFFSI